MSFSIRNSKTCPETGKRAFILIFLVLLAAPGSSQDKAGNSSSGDRFSEELYISTDRDLYITGEDVWIKISKLNRNGHSLTDISKIVYIDLLDFHNNPVIQLKTGTDGKSGSSGFVLPDTLSTGYYIIRSYTNWMKNFSSDLYSYKRISVINPFDVSKLGIPESNSNPDSIIFFPESGYIIDGIETRIGFRTIDKNGMPVKLNSGFLIAGNDTISFVQTGKSGYGWATIKPSYSQRMYLICSDQRRRVKKYLLPETLKEGITLSVGKDENSPVLATIYRSDNYEIKKLFLIKGIAGQSFSKTEIKFDTNNAFNLLKIDFPEGLSQVMVVDEDNNVLINKYLYCKPDRNIKYDIKVENSGSKREKVKVTVTATDKNGGPVESDFSLSVVKSFTTNLLNHSFCQSPDLIMGSYTGSSDINDYLIFYTPDDLLNKVNETQLLFLPELEGHLISGSITERKSGLPLKNEYISLSFVGKIALCQFTRTDEKGNFNFVTDEQGLHEIVIQPLSPELNDCYVELNNSFTTNYNKYNSNLFQIDTAILDDINNALISMQIKKIYQPFSQPLAKKEAEPEKPDFYGAPDDRVQMSSYIELTSLKEVIKEILPSVSTIKKDDKTGFRLISKNQSQTFDNDPFVLIDGVPVNDIEKIININSREIERVDVLTSRYFISDIVLDGILHFVSKSGNLQVIDFDRSVYRLQYELPQYSKEFYSPVYSSDSVKNSRIPDFRNTLFWQPLLHTDKTGYSSIEFYSSDESAEYSIVVEGISSDGRTGRSTSALRIRQ